MSNMFGESKIGGYTKRNRYKLKDGDNIYRVLPAMGALAADGIWSVYYNVIFGFKTLEGKHKPFQSPQVAKHVGKGKDRVTTIEVRCAATDLINKLKDEMEEAKKAGNNQKAQQLAKIVGDYPVMGVYSLNNDHYINVVDRQGNVGQLELGHKAKMALDAEITRLRKDEGYDPLNPNTGRFLNLRRDGKGRDTSVKVTVVKEKINIEGVGQVEKDIVHVIDEALAARLCSNKNGKWVYKEAADLTRLYKEPTAEEVALIVKTADILTGKSAGIDEVFKAANDNQADQGASEQESEQEAAQETQTTQAATTQAAAPAQAAQPAAAAPAAQAAAPTAAAPAQTQVAKEAKAAAAAAPATKTTAEAIAAMSPDDFMKTMGITL